MWYYFAGMAKKNAAAVELGRLGGRVRVPKGVSVLTEEERSERGKEAAAVRWGKGKKKRKKLVKP